MAKARRWEDVRLLSFDLQTVEFTYASVRDVTLFNPPARPISFATHRTAGLHALNILQRPASHWRLLLPPIWAYPRHSSSSSIRHPTKPTRRSRALLTRTPAPRPTRRRPTSTRVHPARHRTRARSTDAHHPRRACDTESRWLVAGYVQPPLWQRPPAAAARTRLSRAHALPSRYSGRLPVRLS